MLSVIAQFTLSSLLGRIFFLTSASVFIVLPIVNHVKMFFAVRRHNKHFGRAAVPLQLTVVLRREKKVALDMLIVSLNLLLSLAPSILNKPIQATFPKVYSILQPWALSMVFFNSSLNPLICTFRNKELRGGLKSTCVS